MYPMRVNKGLGLIYFIWLFFYIIGIPKPVMVALMDVISFSKIIVDMHFKCMSLTFCKPSSLFGIYNVYFQYAMWLNFHGVFQFR
jgi:hypothetical protein